MSSNSNGASGATDVLVGAYQAGRDDGLIAGPEHITLDGSPVCPWRSPAMREYEHYLQGFADALAARAAGAPGGVWAGGDAT